MPKTVLLADDSVTIQKVVGITFANEDVELVTVDNGTDALARVRELRPDIVLADVGMPGLDGYELCAAIKSDPTLARIPVLLLTGTFEGFDERRMSEARAEGQIAKPFEAQVLVDRVWQLLNAAAAPAKTRPEPERAPAPEWAPVLEATRPKPAPARDLPLRTPRVETGLPEQPPRKQSLTLRLAPADDWRPKGRVASPADKSDELPSLRTVDEFPSLRVPDDLPALPSARDEDELPARSAANPKGGSSSSSHIDFSFDDLDFVEEAPSAGRAGDPTQLISRGVRAVDPELEKALYDEDFLQSRPPSRALNADSVAGLVARRADDLPLPPRPAGEGSQSSIFGEEAFGETSMGGISVTAEDEAALEASFVKDDDAPLVDLDDSPIVEGLEPLEDEADEPLTRVLFAESALPSAAHEPERPAAARVREPDWRIEEPDEFDAGSVEEVARLAAARTSPHLEPDSSGESAELDLVLDPPRADPSGLSDRDFTQGFIAEPALATFPADALDEAAPLAGQTTVAFPERPLEVSAVAPPEPASRPFAPAATSRPSPMAPRDEFHLDPRVLEEALEKVAWEAFGSLSEHVIAEVRKRVEAIAWEAIPKIAERLISEELERLRKED